MTLLERVDPGVAEGGLKIVRRLRAKGHEAVFAGGVVRDLLLRLVVADIDIATSATPRQVEELFEKTIPIGKRFGVVLVGVGSHHYEVTTFREDSGYVDGRRPIAVNYSDLERDAIRRDFTINALYLDPESGEVIDHVGGRADLEARLVRSVGSPEERFDEDKLRLLRAVRFASGLGFEIEPETERAIRKCSGDVLQVSSERIRDEILKILTGADASRGLMLLEETGLLEQVLPEVAAMDGVEQPPQFHPEGDVFVHTRLMFELSDRLDEILAMGVLLHDVGKPDTFEVRERIRFDGHAELGAEMADEICRRLRLSNQQRETVVQLVRYHLRFMHVREMRPSTLKRFLRIEDFEKHLELHRLDCLASHGDLTNYDFCRRKLEELEAEPLRPDPLINGHDLIRLGLVPGPVFSKILKGVEDQQLEGALTSRDDALEWVKTQSWE